MRPPTPTIGAPPFPQGLTWINSPPLRMERQVGHPVLIEFWDFCRVNSLRTLPYVAAWHERYGAAGLTVIGVHAGGFPPSRDTDAIAAAVGRLGIRHPVVIDADWQIWRDYGNAGWPARYLWTASGTLASYHYGEGAYAETEREIQALLDIEREPLAPLRAIDEPGLQLPEQTPDQEGPYSGPYEAGAVWAVLEGSGRLTVNGRAIAVEHPGCYELIAHQRHSAGVLELALDPGVTCHAVCFTPGLP